MTDITDINEILKLARANRSLIDDVKASSVLNSELSRFTNYSLGSFEKAASISASEEARRATDALTANYSWMEEIKASAMLCSERASKAADFLTGNSLGSERIGLLSAAAEEARKAMGSFTTNRSWIDDVKASAMLSTDGALRASDFLTGNSLSSFESIGLLSAAKEARRATDFFTGNTLGSLESVGFAGAAEEARKILANLSSNSSSDLFDHNEFDISSVLNLRNIPDKPVIDYEWLEETSNSGRDEVEEIYRGASEEIAEKQDFHLLSDEGKKVALWLLKYVLLTFHAIAIGLLVNEISQHREKAQKVMQRNHNPSEIKAIARGKSSPEFNRSALKGDRVTIINSLNLHDEPKKKSEVIRFLPLGTVLEVLDTAPSRSWLQVSVIIDGEEELGWILRRHTKYFK